MSNMEIRGSKWTMLKKRRKKPHPLRLAVLVFLILAMVYVDKAVIPTMPKPFVATPTPTTNPESFVTAAQKAFREGRLAIAIKDYQRAILENPDNPALHVALARIQLLTGQYAAALTSAENALLLNPDYSMAHAIRGYALHKLGNDVEAQTELQRAIELDPNNGLAHAFLAEVYVDQRLYQKADEEIRKALKLAPTELEVRQIYGYILVSEGPKFYKRAVEEYQAALAINKNIPALHIQLGLLYRLQQRYNDAIDEFLKADALNPTDPMPNAYIATTYAAEGQFGRALQFAAKAVEEAPGDPYMHGNYGILLYKNGKYAEAVKELALAVRGGKTDSGVIVKGLPLDYGRVADYYSIYGLALVKIGRCDEAIPIFQAILANIPTAEAAVYNAKEGLSMCRAQAEGTATPGVTATPGEGTPTPTAAP